MTNENVATANTHSDYLDPNEFYAAEMDSWRELWDESLSLYKNVENIMNQLVMLPQKDLMIPIVVNYILIPSKWARVLPVLFSWGGKGSGKSTTSVFAAKLHGINSTFSATDTFSAIRNALDNMRWINPQEKDKEREGAILPWDNIHIGTFQKDERIYQLLLFGYSRQTDKISIASPDGTNKEYFVFCPKIISSVDDLHLEPSLEELHRRLLIIPHKSWSDFTKEEKKQYEGFDINLDRIDLDSICWDGIEKQFYDFWNNSENGKKYAKYRNALTGKGRKLFKHSMRSEQWLISVDLIVTGLVAGCWLDIGEAIKHLERYWEYANKSIFCRNSPAYDLLQEFIISEYGEQLKMNEELIEKNITPKKIRIPAKSIKNKIEDLRKDGAIEITGKPKEIANVMSRLGWSLTAKGWEQKNANL
jgi:hypothetical protein